MSRREDERRAFIHSIRESPEDDAPRLIYSDWLEDNGDSARAEFIRVQCELARLAPQDERRARLLQRESALLQSQANRRDWLGPLYEELNFDHCTYHRGFPAALTIRPRTMVKFAEDIEHRVPGARVKPYGGFGDPALKAMTKSSHMDWVTGLEWKYTSNLTEAGLVALGEAKNLPRLEAISVTDRLSTAGVRALAGSPHRGALRELFLYHSGHDGIPPPASAEAFADASVCFRLRSLSLQGQRIDSGGAELLAQASHLSELTTLDLLLNRIEDKGAKAIARSPHFRRLTKLNLHLNGLTAKGIRALVDSPILDTVRDLALGCNDIGDDGAALLAKCARLAGLTNLTLFRAELTDRGAEALAKSPHLSNVTRLELVGNDITDRGSQALRESPHLQRLEWIRMGRGSSIDEPLISAAERKRWKQRLEKGADV